MSLKTITGSQAFTLGALQHDSQFDIRLEELTTSDTVQEFKAVISKDLTLVNLGEFIELVTPYDQVHAAAAPILVELVTPYDQVHAAAAPILVELVTPYDQVHAAAAPILVELTCCIIPLDAVWTSCSYFQHFF